MVVMSDNSDFFETHALKLVEAQDCAGDPHDCFHSLMWCGIFGSHIERKGHQGIAGDNLNFLQKSFLVHESTKRHVTFMGHFYEPERDVIVAFSFQKRRMVYGNHE